jgi:hypothetical protein
VDERFGAEACQQVDGARGAFVLPVRVGEDSQDHGAAPLTAPV